MKCRKRSCPGSGALAGYLCMGFPVYVCQLCGRRWAVKPRKRVLQNGNGAPDNKRR